ncbi:hypothetical protein MTO96_026803 [Rhipicephalus appendiculatus]
MSKGKNLAKLGSLTPPPPPLTGDVSKDVSACPPAQSAVPSPSRGDAGVTEGWTAAVAPPAPPASLFDDLVAVQQRDVLNPSGPGRRFSPVGSVAASDPPPPWCDAVSAQHTQQSDHVPYVVDELACLPSKEERVLASAPNTVSFRRLSRGIVVWYVSAVALLEWKASAPFVTCLGAHMLAAFETAGLEYLFGNFGVNFTDAPGSTTFIDLKAVDVQAPFLFRVSEGGDIPTYAPNLFESSRLFHDYSKDGLVPWAELPVNRAFEIKAHNHCVFLHRSFRDGQIEQAAPVEFQESNCNLIIRL